MKAHALNLFIVENDESLAKQLKDYLMRKFGAELNVSLFKNEESCLEMIDRDTHVVILENTNDKNGAEMVKDIKDINDKTEVILMSNEENIAESIEAYQAGAKDVVLKSESWKRIHNTVRVIFMAPIRFIEREMDISTFLAMIMMSCVTIAFIVFMWAIIWHKF